MFDFCDRGGTLDEEETTGAFVCLRWRCGCEGGKSVETEDAEGSTERLARVGGRWEERVEEDGGGMDWRWCLWWWWWLVDVEMSDWVEAIASEGEDGVEVEASGVCASEGAG